MSDYLSMWFIVATVYYIVIMIRLFKIEKMIEEKDTNITIITRKGETDA